MTTGTTNEQDRHNWIINKLQQIPKGGKILDAGAGECPYKKYCTHLTYVSQDFAAYDGTGNAGLQTGTWDNTKLDIVSDITQIPVPDASFDAVMCTEVLEHVPDAVAALNELTRLVKPGGYLLLTSPFASLTHFAPYHFASGFNRYFYEHHLEKMGYVIVELSFNGNYFEYLAQELRRVNMVAKKYSGKKLSFFQRVYRYLLLSTLQKFSAADKGSTELLAYGVHVFAQKK